jgi:hypothetical protein
MCFGPSNAEKQAAADARTEAEQVKRAEIEGKAVRKRDTIFDALTGREGVSSLSGGTGRRSLLSAGGSAGRGYASRFDT